MVRHTIVPALALTLALVAVPACDSNPLSPGADVFPGVWLNLNTGTGENPRAEITRNGSLLTVHMWGACVPIDCDWGEVSAPASEAQDGEFQVVFDSSVARRQLTLSVTEDDQLRIHSAVNYYDARPDRENVELFRRAVVPAILR